MDQSALRLLSKIGTDLRRGARPNKDTVVKSLREAVGALSKLEQPLRKEPPDAGEAEATRKLEASITPLKKTIVDGLLQHRDKDVRLLVAICVTEMFRLMAPEPPFEDRDLRGVFKLLISVFAELGDTASSLFSKRAKTVEIVAQLKCYLIMLDIDCDDLILEMFNTFFSVVREHHQPNLIKNMLSIMTNLLNEEASQPLLEVVLHNLLNEEKDTASASSQLAISVIQSCAEKLEPLVCGFLTSCILDRDAIGSELKEFYHKIIFKIFECAPEILRSVLPRLTQELLTDQVDVRIKAVKLVGKFLTLPEHHISRKCHDLFTEFLKRFSDISVDVRVSALQCTKLCYVANPSGEESQKLLSYVEGRLLDFDDKVRKQAVIISCDLAMSNLRYFLPKLISLTTERLRDKKVSIRKTALQKLLEVYRHYCNKCSEGCIIPAMSEHFEQIPCKILMLCYDKDCKEFRSQNMELVLAEDLFPASLSAEERTRHWIHLFSRFTPVHLKALNSILSQKQRLQGEMRTYLALRKSEKGNNPEEMQKSYRKMAVSFVDHSKAEECFDKLNQMKDNNIFKLLALLLDERIFIVAQTTRDKFLNMIGEKHQNFDFLRTLSSKCSYNIFSSEHVRCILDILSKKNSAKGNCDSLGNKDLEASLRLLLAIANFFPTLLKGSETQFQTLLEETNPINDKLIEVLARAGTNMSVKLSEIYPFLKRVCLEGTRSQAKHAVSAVAALSVTSTQSFFSSLCKELVESLHSEQNMPTVLQSLGCLAQYSVSTFESQDAEITSYIYENIFQVDSSDNMNYFDNASGCSNSCKLKIYGLKTLVKSFLPHGGTHTKRRVDELWDILSIMLQKGETVDGITSCESDKACRPCIRLAAAKSVLRLARRWDFHIFPQIFQFTISMAKDDSPLVRRSFLEKTHKLLKGHAIPSRYACAFPMATSDCLEDLQDDSFKYMAEFIKDYGREALAHQVSGVQEGLITSFPAYIVVFLIHLLAHDTSFPHEDCQDEEICAQFCRPLIVFLDYLVNASGVDGVKYLLCIFCAIKRAEDALDVERTPRLHFLADIGYSFVTSTNDLSLDGPEKILLPSSLYKSNSRCLSQLRFDVKRVLLKSKIFLSSSTFQKCRHKCQEKNIKSDVVKDETGVSTRHRQKRALSPSAPGLDEKVASKKSDISMRKKQLSSCDSAAAKSSLDEPNVSIPNVKSSTAVLKENRNLNSSIDEEHSNHRRGKLKDPSSLTPRIICDSSGDVQVVSLETDSWETLSDGLLEERPKQNLKEKSSLDTSESEQNVRKKTSVDTSESEVLTNDDAVAKRTRGQKKLRHV